jgi:RNA polymerase sigma factor (sigma-70 family)
MLLKFNRLPDDITLSTMIAEGGFSQEKALSQINRSYQGLIDDLLHKHSGLSRELAEEAFDDALIALRDNIVAKKFKGDSTIKTYFYRIFKNKCIDKLRENPTIVQMDEQLLSDGSGHVNFAEQTEERELERVLEIRRAGCLQKALWTLSEKERDMLSDIYIGGMKPREVAVKYGYKDNQVASQTIYKTKEKLKKSIEYLCANEPECRILCQPGKRITLI